MIKVIKRDGREVDFNETRIIKAIESAMKRTEKGCDIELAKKISDSIQKVEKKIMAVEEIQDLVENKLMASSRKDVAKEYITYRNERTKQREIDGELYHKVSAILNCENITNDNANIDQYSFSGKENRVGEELHKRYAKDNLLREVVKKAFDSNYIYLHDFGKYSTGMHNCLFSDNEKLLKEGFTTRNGDVRGANSINTAFQLCAVIFQCQSQVQFGGVGSIHIDFDLEPYVKKSFKKHFKEGLKYLESMSKNEIYKMLDNIDITLDDIEYKEKYPNVWNYAYDMLYKEGLQSAQAFYHNLNTLESRAGSQVPFTSINLGRDTTKEGQLITEWIFKASIDGIGKLHRTSIFPISIFQYKKGINDKDGTPNYHLKQLAIDSMCKRIYPNWVNCDFTNNIEDLNDINTTMATMGCRTMLGYDRFTNSYTKVGRGNIVPTTIILPKLGIDYGIVTGERTSPDIDGFWNKFDEILETTKISLLDRFAYISNQSPKSAPFMYQNGSMLDADKCLDTVYEAIKHSTLAIGYIGIAEMCQALFGKNHAEDKIVHDFALSVIKHIYDFAKDCSEKYNLNFSTYATPAENLCNVAMNKLKAEYGIIPKVTEKSYLTNSHHVPVWEEISIFKKLQIEAPFCYYATGGCITYIELESSIMNNKRAVERIIDYAMNLNIPYLAFNFPIDTCLDCGYQGEFNDKCLLCESKNIEQLRRVTGYLTKDYKQFNKGKIDETNDRVKHSIYTDFGSKY